MDLNNFMTAARVLMKSAFGGMECEATFANGVTFTTMVGERAQGRRDEAQAAIFLPFLKSVCLGTHRAHSVPKAIYNV
jgi:hypothetical protein